MSNVFEDYLASNAIDGKFTNDGCGTRYARTQTTSDAWIRIDLPEWRYVVFFEIYNRHLFRDRLSNAEFYVFGANPGKNRQFCNRIENGDGIFFKRMCKKPLYGKGVELSQPPNADQFIQLCESSCTLDDNPKRVN